MNEQNPLNSILAQIRAYHYIVVGLIIAGAFVFMGYSVLQIINGTSDPAYESKMRNNINTEFDAKTLRRIGELQYSSVADENGPAFPSRNPFE